MPLPLTARKSLKEHDESFKEAHEVIKKALGVEWTVEIDIEDIFAKVQEDYVKTDPGRVFYKNIILDCVAPLIEDTVKDPLVKESLLAANTQNKIILRVNDDKKETAYFKYVFESGALVLLFRLPLCNVNDSRYFDLKPIIPSPGVYSLLARVNLKESQEKFDESFKQIKEVTKLDWSLDQESLEKVYPSIEPTYRDRVGSVFANIVEKIAYNIVTRCKDEMVLEGFNEVTANHTLIFRFDPKAYNYWTWSFEGGNLIVTFKAICNVDDNNYFDFEKLL